MDGLWLINTKDDGASHQLHLGSRGYIRYALDPVLKMSAVTTLQGHSIDRFEKAPISLEVEHEFCRQAASRDRRQWKPWKGRRGGASATRSNESDRGHAYSGE